MGTEPATATAVVAEVMQALATPAGQADPYPHYARLRAIGPAVTGPDDVVVVVGHRACVSVLRDHRLAKSPGLALVAAGYPDWESRPSLRMMFGSILMLNPPAHTRLRSIVSKAFTPRKVAGLRPAVQRIVDDLCDHMVGDTDFVTTMAFPLPVTVIGELLGIPAADRPSSRPWSGTGRWCSNCSVRWPSTRLTRQPPGSTPISKTWPLSDDCTHVTTSCRPWSSTRATNGSRPRSS